jgi:hypothetical protein
MTGYNLLLFVHVIASMAWLGGGVVLFLLAIRARGSTTALQTFATWLPYVGIRLLMPSVVLVPITGIWMVLIDSEWSFEQAWVRIAVGLFLVAFAIGAVYLSTVGVAMARAAGTGSANLPTLVNRWMGGYAVVLVVLLVVVGDMVFKPGAA